MATLDEKSGFLTTLPPARLFLRAENLEFSGIVALARESDKRVYLFDRGKPVSARSNVEGEYLGALLKAGNKITIAQEEAAVRKMTEDPSKHFGEALMSLGFIDASTLIQFLCEQMLLRFNKALEWKDGRYAFVPNLPEDAPKIIQNDSVSSICFRGLLKRYSNSAEVRDLQTTAVPVVVGGQTIDIARLQLDGKQMAFYRSINGVSTISEIVKSARLNEASAKPMLLALQEIQFIRIETRETAREAQAPAVANEIAKRWETCQKQNHFEVLGLTEKATADDVKRTYLDCARKYHPDRLPKTLPPDIQKKAETFFARISEANSVLSNSVTRKDYEASLAASAAGFTEDAAKKAIESELEYQKGIIALRKGQFDLAVEALKHAVELYDQEPEYLIYLGWALFRRSAKMGKSREFDNAKQMINKGLKQRENFAEGFYFLGQIAKSENDIEKTKKYFSHTLTLNPRHPEASSELRLINRRKDNVKPSLGGLFRKAQA